MFRVFSCKYFCFIELKDSYFIFAFEFQKLQLLFLTSPIHMPFISQPS